MHQRHLIFNLFLTILSPLILHAQETVYVQTSISPLENGLMRVEERGHIRLPLGDRMVEKRFVLRYPELVDVWNGKLVVGAHAGPGGPWFWNGTWGDNAGDTMMDDAIGTHALSQRYAYASFDRDGVTDVRQGLAMTNSFTRFIQQRLRSTLGLSVTRTYLAGMSDGGAIARFAAESADAPYNGVLIIAGKGGDPGSRLERQAVMAGLWPRIDPRVLDHPEKVTRSVRNYADAVGTSVRARPFWMYGGVHAELDELRYELASLGLTGLSDQALRKFRVKSHRENAVFMGRLTARTPTGRIRMPTLEIVGAYDDIVLRDALTYRKRVKRHAPDRHRLYLIPGAWHISGDDETIESFIIRMRQKGVSWERIGYFWGAQRSYLSHVKAALAHLDEWVVRGTPPPEEQLIPQDQDRRVSSTAAPRVQSEIPSSSMPYVLKGMKLTDDFKKILHEAPRLALSLHNSEVHSDHLMLAVLLAHNYDIDVALYHMGVDLDLLARTYEIKTGYRMMDADGLKRTLQAWWRVETRTPVDGEKTHTGRLFVTNRDAIGLMVDGVMRVIPVKDMTNGVILREGDGDVVANMEVREFQTLQRGQWMIITRQPVDGMRVHEGPLIQQNRQGIELGIGDANRHIPLDAIHLMAIKSEHTEKNLPASPDEVYLTDEYYHTLKAAALEAKALQDEAVDIKHLFLALTKLTRQHAADTLSEFNVDYDKSKMTIESLEH